MTTTREALTDLRERLAEKVPELQKMAATPGPPECHRLTGKAQGVDLAISFVDEMIRALPTREDEEAVQCLNCDGIVPISAFAGPCPDSPEDPKGPHEGYAPAWMCPRGFTTHGPGCPRGRPMLYGPEVVGSCVCTCRTNPEAVTSG